MSRAISYPFDPSLLLRKRRSLLRELREKKDLFPCKVAILGGSTTHDVKEFLELFLLDDGIAPQFYESEYNRFKEDLLFPNPALTEFSPDVIYLHTSHVNIDSWPSLLAPNDVIEAFVNRYVGETERLWQKAEELYPKAMVIQNNLDLPPFRSLGSREALEPSSTTQYILKINDAMAQAAKRHNKVTVHDIFGLSSQLGTRTWFDHSHWFSYKQAATPSATIHWSYSLKSLINAIYGKTKKCLILDLDNTLWGGVIGDDGLAGIRLGSDTAQGEAYAAFQCYAKTLKERGIILAVCSKNNEDTAREGFTHTDSILKLDDIAAFIANWEPKSENILKIAKLLNLGLDSFVFVDDNPAERELVRAQLPQVAVPEVGDDVARYPLILDELRYFEPYSISGDDLRRAEFYRQNQSRLVEMSSFTSYSDYLKSLEMSAVIAAFDPMYLERITQLTNKTNQFNLTTRRYTMSEMQEVASSKDFVTLYGRLIDKFGDNGIVSIVLGKRVGETLDLDLWLMSCRVLKRDMELAMFDALIEECQKRAIKKISGAYIPTAKNAMVSDHYLNLGFKKTSIESASTTTWEYSIPANYELKNSVINKVNP